MYNLPGGTEDNHRNPVSITGLRATTFDEEHGQSSYSEPSQ
jgi:hypothetical protein